MWKHLAVPVLLAALCAGAFAAERDPGNYFKMHFDALVTVRDVRPLVEPAAELSKDPKPAVRLVSYGQGRAEKAFMPAANVPASRQALARAGVTMRDIKAVKTHNPFAVNDIYFARQMEIEVSAMNRYGSSLVWGHPQAPTGARLIIELIEELVLAGGGYGLFTGCAAGDTAFAVVVEVD